MEIVCLTPSRARRSAVCRALLWASVLSGCFESATPERDEDVCLATLGGPCDEVVDSYLKASNADVGDWFGYNVSLSGDTLAVGVPSERSAATGVDGDQADNSAFSSGAVYVFQRTGGTWTQQAYLKSSNSDMEDRFGSSVSLSGDTLAVGAMFEASMATGVGGDAADNSARESGAVYIFQRSGGTWRQEAYLKASNTDVEDRFGVSVSLSGDTLAVGAMGEDSAATSVGGDERDNSARESGAVYVFQRTDGTWTQQAYLKASNTDIEDVFGFRVSLSGDTLAVAAWGEDSMARGVDGDQADNSASLSGAVYVFERTEDMWTQEAYLKASNADTEDRFGHGLSLSGDTLAVGTGAEDSAATGIDGDQADNSASRAGAVYVFERSGGAWTQQAYLKASSTQADDQFGGCVSLSGDILAIAAVGEDSAATGMDGDHADNSASLSGAVYIFQRTEGRWTQRAYLKAPNPDSEDFFGRAVSLSDDALAIGASHEDGAATGVDGDQTDNSARQSGAVYTYRIAL